MSNSYVSNYQLIHAVLQESDVHGRLCGQWAWIAHIIFGQITMFLLRTVMNCPWLGLDSFRSHNILNCQTAMLIGKIA